MCTAHAVHAHGARCMQCSARCTCAKVQTGSCTCLPPPLTMPSILAALRIERIGALVYTTSSLPGSGSGLDLVVGAGAEVSSRQS